MAKAQATAERKPSSSISTLGQADGSPDHTRRQRHINVAIVYNIWQYWQTSGDLEFLSFYCGEMILEIARFWASIATYNHELDRYEIGGIMGSGRIS